MSLSGDSDTLACIAGGMADAFFGGVPPEMQSCVKNLLTSDLWKSHRLSVKNTADAVTGKNLCLDSSNHIRYKTASCFFTLTNRT